MVNHWESGLYADNIREIKKKYLTDKEKIINTNDALDFFDKNHTININKVLEVGCNVGRNLRIASERYRCQVVGYDINQEVIEECKNYFGESGQFYTKNLMKYDLADYEDDYFDLGITMGFLMHIEKGEAKDRLIKGLIRVCKYVLMYELYDEDSKKEDGNYDNEYFLSFDDYTQYDKNIVDTGIKKAKAKLKLYFYNGGLKWKK